MLDRLLGREELQERIEELEEERDRLQSQLTAEEDRRREAVSARQEAQERVNRLEDKIAELEDRMDRLQEGTDPDLTVRGRESIRGERLETVLDRLRSVRAGSEGALSAMVAGEPPAPVRDAFGDRIGLVRRVEPALVYRDDAGLVSAALVPPLPPDPFHEWADQFRIETGWFRPTGRFAFGLVRADTFALGVYEANERVDFDGFTSDVMDDHSKGGFSQARFERRRDEQVDAHLERCRDALTEHIDVDRTILVGARGAVEQLADTADHVAGSDATGSPEAALDDAFRDFWTVRMVLL